MDIHRVPQQGAQQGEETGEAVRPLAAPGQKAQEDVDQQCRPYLPLDCILVVPEEAAQLERLLYLLEERFDGPASLV